MKTERWVNTYRDIVLADSTYVCFMKGLYDCTDIMSDSVRPAYMSSGEYRISLVPQGAVSESDADFVVYTNADWANKIWYNLKHYKFADGDSLRKALRATGELVGKHDTYVSGIVKDIVEIGL